jgi:hypothetical protein
MQMTKEKMVSLTLGQHLALLVAYRQLTWDLKRKTKTSPPLKNLSKLLNQNFKNKKEAFTFIHDLLEYNGEEVMNLCGMGDCPGKKINGIPSTSVGMYQVTWQEDVGVQSKQTKLCQDCKDYLIKNKMIKDVPVGVQEMEK